MPISTLRALHARSHIRATVTIIRAAHACHFPQSKYPSSTIFGADVVRVCRAKEPPGGIQCGPTLKLTDSAGKAVAVKMQNGFTVAKSGTYQLTIEGTASLKNTANVDNLVLNARSVLPTKSGDANIDALLMGGTRNWWRPDGALAVVGTEKISSKANGLAAGSSATALTYSFLSAPQAGKDPTGFQQMTSAQKDAVRAVFAQYSKYINVTFTEVNNSGTGDINFGTDIQTGSAGYATLPNSDASGKSYVYLANNSTTNNDAGVQEGGYGRLTIMHEVGHGLGLKHLGNYNAGGVVHLGRFFRRHWITNKTP